jgi:DNA-binding SARP family transcriptional activator
MFVLRILGPIELLDGNGRSMESVLSQPKRLGLLAHLAGMMPHFARRDALLALFWPDLDTAHARAALNQAVRFLRKELGEATILSRGADELGIGAGTLLCDVGEFRRSIEQNDSERAIALYRGDYLQSFHLDAAPELDQAIADQRAVLRAAAARAARKLAEHCESDERFTTAVISARRAVELSRADERVLRELLELLDRLGDRAGALQAYEDFARRVSAEYGVEPSAETRATIERIRRR